MVKQKIRVSWENCGPSPVWPEADWPERFAVDADLLEDVFKELGSALLNHMMDPQAGLQVLQESPQEAQEVLGGANGAGDGLWRGEALVWVLKPEPHGQTELQPCRISSGKTGFAR